MRGVAKFARAREARRRPAAEPHPGKTPLPWTGPQRTHDVPDNNGPAAGGVIQGPGHRAGRKLERVEFPAFVAKQALLGFVPPAMQPLGGILLLF